MCERAGDATVRPDELTKRARPYDRMGKARASTNSMRRFHFSVNRDFAWLKAPAPPGTALCNPLNEKRQSAGARLRPPEMILPIANGLESGELPRRFSPL